MVRKKKNITILIIVIVSIIIVGGVLTWGFLTNWGQGKKSEPGTKSEPVKYTVPKKIPKGTNKIEIENPESYGFKIGQEIEIGTGESRERRTIVGFGSLILDRPLTREYPKNTEITVVLEPVKKDFKVDNCHEYTVDLTCMECEKSHYLEDNKCKKYSYTGTQDECNKNKGIFTKGTSSSDQTCVECGDKENKWVDTSNGNQVCTVYTTQKKCADKGEWFNSSTKGPTSDATCREYKNNNGNCNVEDRKILTMGTSPTSDNSKCRECSENQYVTDNDCNDYTYTKSNCSGDDKRFTEGTYSRDGECVCIGGDNKWLYQDPYTKEVKCYDVVESEEILKNLIKDPLPNGYEKNQGEYTYGTKNYGPMRTFKLHEDITDLSGLFKGTYNGTLPLRKNTFNKDISGWDVSNVRNMSEMFRYSAFNGDISKWNVGNVTTMRNMFKYAEFNGDISDWDVRKVKDMYGMFYYAFNFNQPIGKWRPESVTTVERMLWGFNLRTLNFYQDLNSWCPWIKKNNTTTEDLMHPLYSRYFNIKRTGRYKAREGHMTDAKLSKIMWYFKDYSVNTRLGMTQAMKTKYTNAYNNC